MSTSDPQRLADFQVLVVGAGFPGVCMSLEPLLRPRSIAVIGASDNKARDGGVPVDLLKRAGLRPSYPRHSAYN